MDSVKRNRKQLRVGLMFGGRSTEHEVSITSATTIFHGLEAAGFEIVLLGIAHDGTWRCAESDVGLTPDTFFSASGATPVVPSLARGLELARQADGKSALSSPLDAVFPILHGREGEGGMFQGLFDLARVPYVGSGVLGSALCMDKSLSKAVLRDAGIPVLPSVEHTREQIDADLEACLDRIEAEIDYPIFVKPTVTGSSVGVHKAKTRVDLGLAVKSASELDTHVLAEAGISAREVECAVLGGYTPEASVVGEITMTSEFYDYDAKYRSETTQLIIPAQIPDELAERIQKMAIEAFRVTRSFGMARVDFFVERETGRVYLNELNSLPGFTSGSMYPLLWQASGVELPSLVERLVEIAISRQREREQLVERYSG